MIEQQSGKVLVGGGRECGGLSLDVEGDKTPALMLCPICEVCPVSHSLGQALCLNETNLNK